MADMTANPPRGAAGRGFGATREAPAWGSLPGAQRWGAEGRADRVPPRAAARAEPPLALRQPEPEAFDDFDAYDEEVAADLDPIFGTTPASLALAGFNAKQSRGRSLVRSGLLLGGGVLSLALVGLIGVWGYKVVVREVLGVPVIAAEAGPMRLVPEEPGGSVTPDMGLAVNAVAGDGTAAPPSDVLTLAPATTQLAEEDMAVVQTDAEAGEVEPLGTETTVAETVLPDAAATPAAAQPAPAPEAVLAAAAPLAAADPTPTAGPSLLPPADLPADLDALADAIAGDAAPLAPLAAGPTPPVATEVVAEAGAARIRADVPGVAVALRPAVRPASRVTAVAQTSATAAAAEPEPSAAVEIPAGAQLVQLGAFDSEEIAAAEWDRLQARFGEFLGDRTRVIQVAESGGRTFYRLRAMGFADIGEARRICAALDAEDTPCILAPTQ